MGCSMNNEIDRERWAVIQTINAKDIADAISDCPALADAVRNSDWRGVGQLVKSRIELQSQRIAELRVIDKIKTPWVDQSAERKAYKTDYSQRVEQMLNRRMHHENEDELGRGYGGTL
jgi:hypothetical protein